VQRSDHARAFERGIGGSDALVDERLLLLHLGDERVELRLLLFEVGLLGAEVVLQFRDLRARVLQLLRVRVVGAGGRVAQLLAPHTVHRGAREHVGHAGAVTAGHVERAGAFPESLEEQAPPRGQRGALLVHLGDARAVVGDLCLHRGVLLGDLLELGGRGVGVGLRLLQLGPGLHHRGIGVDQALLRTGRTAGHAERGAEHQDDDDRHHTGRDEPDRGVPRQADQDR